MNRGGGLRHGSIGATPRPRPQAVSAHPGGSRLPNPAHGTGTRQGLLTERERAARANIERVLPHARVHVQVSMGALLQAKSGLAREAAMRACNTFSQKIVDFVIEDRASGAILPLVELDDLSHNAFRDRLRDAMTASAGYRTICLPAGRLTTADIAARLQPLQPAIATVANSPSTVARRRA